MPVSIEIHKKLENFQLNINFTSKSRRIGILGGSGSGKSMTLKSIAGIVQPDSGYISVDGKSLFDGKEKINLRPQNRNVGYLFQNYALFPTMTVEKNIAAGLHGNRKKKELRVREMIKKFRLQGLEKHLPGQLSGGQQQRAAIARIMAYEPDMILLDEPFSALDMYLKDQLQREMAQMMENYQGIVIMVSHNRDEIFRFSEEILIIDQGRSVVSGETKEIFRNPVSLAAARLTGCKNFSRARRINSHTAEALDWGITFTTEREIPEYTEWVGFRAHDFIAVWKSDRNKFTNMIPFRMDSSAELPFERNYYIKAEKNTTVCWFVQRETEYQIEKKGMPDYLAFDENKLLFLK